MQTKLAELVGEEDEDLVTHVMKLVDARVTAQRLADAVRDVLDEEADMFVVRLWRFIIFETVFAKICSERGL